MKSTLHWASSLALLLAITTAPAWGQQSDDLESDGEAKPWEADVSDDDQATAKALFNEGNDFLSDSLFVKAADKYREALDHWDHPGIQFNLALALLQLDQPLQVFKSLEKAMRYGPEAIGIQMYDRAQQYKTLVEKQLARATVECKEPEAKVTMNGQLLFVGPGKWDDLVRVGEHTVVATKPGYITQTETQRLDPGGKARFLLEMYTPDDVTIETRRFKPWKPWATVAFGTVVAATGGFLHWKSDQDFTEFDRLIEICNNEAPEGVGCMPDQATLDVRERARLEQNVAVGAYIAGGLAFTTGLVLVFINRPKSVRTDVKKKTDKLTIAPIVSPHATGVSALFRF